MHNRFTVLSGFVALLLLLSTCLASVIPEKAHHGGLAFDNPGSGTATEPIVPRSKSCDSTSDFSIGCGTESEPTVPASGIASLPGHSLVTYAKLLDKHLEIITDSSGKQVTLGPFTVIILKACNKDDDHSAGPDEMFFVAVLNVAEELSKRYNLRQVNGEEHNLPGIIAYGIIEENPAQVLQDVKGRMITTHTAEALYKTLFTEDSGIWKAIKTIFCP